MSRAFSEETRPALERGGWSVVTVPDGLSLARLRQEGAPFKGTKYFDRFDGAAEAPPGEVAYQGALDSLLPESLNQPFERGRAAMMARLGGTLPAATRLVVGSATTYCWLLLDHHRRTGEWLLAGRYTWTADLAGGMRVAVGVFGRERPLLVSPIPEGQGRGIGIMPLVEPP